MAMKIRYHEHFGDVASAKDFMDGGKFVGLVGGEVWRKGAFLSATPSQEFAGGARSYGI